MVFSGQALVFQTSLFSRSKNKPGGIKFPCKEIKYAPTLFDKRKELSLYAKQNDGERIFPHNNVIKGNVANGEGREEVSSSFNANTRSSENLEEIISLFSRIRSSISRESAYSKERSRQSSKDSRSVESVFEVLREPHTRLKGRTTRQEKDQISQHSPSKTARSTPASSPNLEEFAFLGNESLLTSTGEIRHSKQDDVHTQNIQEMKLHELKQLAKLRGIKGYSKLKKEDLVQLLSIT